MKPEYLEWIKKNVIGDGYGECAEITAAMVKAFPELTRVRGHYLCYIWGERAHWWLTTPSGEIVDPTVNQFPSKGKAMYIPWNEGRPEPTGICQNCGDKVYHGDLHCSNECYRLAVQELMGSI